MSLLVATRADEGVKELIDLTHGVIQHYAGRCGADFTVLADDFPVNGSHSTGDESGWRYRILMLSNLLSHYDRIIHLDSDILIKPDCPNLFMEVPVHCVGAVREDVGSRQVRCDRVMKSMHLHFGENEWTTNYINTGVLVISKEHRKIFDSIRGEYWTGDGYDSAHLSWNIAKHTQLHELPYQFNHMSMFSEPWNGSPSKDDSHIVHYSGRATRSIPDMREDFKRAWGDKFQTGG